MRNRGRTGFFAGVIAIVSLVLGACSGMGTADRDQSAQRSTAANRQILLTVRTPGALAAGLTGAPSQRYLNRRYGATPAVDRTLNQLARDHDLQRVDGWPIESLGVYCEVYEIPAGASVDEVVARVSSDSRVDLVQRMNLFRTESTRYDDPYVELQSAAVELEVEQAHRSATGRDVLIAIVDSGIDAGHPDLRGRITVARNLVDPRKSARSGEVHGTAVAGVIASAVNNSEGIIGVAPDVSIAALRACWAIEPGGTAAQCSSFSLAQAFDVARRLAPKVLNLSLAGPEDALLSRLLDRIIAAGIVVVAAQPETPSDGARFPASHPGVLVAHASDDSPDTASHYRLGAPAKEVLTTMPGASYAFLSGNSLAAAHTTGVIALLMEREPALDVERIAALLAETMTASTGRYSINACRALDRLNGTQICDRATEVARF